MTTRLLLLSLLLALIFPLSSQDHEILECGTVVPPYSFGYEQKMAAAYAAAKAKSGVQQMQELPIQVFVITTDAGGGGITTNQVDDAIDELNAVYAGGQISFSQCNPPEFVPNDQFYNFSVGEEDDLFSTVEQPGVINIYVIGGSITQNDIALCGFAFFPWSPDRYHLLVVDACFVNGSSLAHEMGHTLGLYHTHETSFGIELVDGSNCEEAGDLLCDTPADPLLGEGNVNFLCEYTGTETDPNGDGYSPDHTNIMSYARRTCRDHLSEGQLQRARFFATTAADQLSCDGSTVGQEAATCEEAIEITENGIYLTDGPGSGNGCQNCTDATHADWYFFDAPTTGQIFIESCGGGVDTRLWVYTGGCTILDLVASADDECEMGPGLQPFASRVVNLPVIAGTRVFLEWDNRWSDAGFEFDFSFFSSTTCPNVDLDTEFFVLDTGYAHIELTWNSDEFQEEHRLRYRAQPDTIWTTEDWQGGSYRLLDNLDPCSTYEIQIQSSCANNLISPWSRSLLVGTEGCEDNYCYSYGSSRRHYIDTVKVGNSFENISGNNHGYELFDDPQVDIILGQPFAIEMRPGSNNPANSAPHLWRVWLDMNMDNVFDPETELLLEEITSGPITSSFNLPEDLPLTTTRMRISLSTEGFRDPCQIGGNADVEDYVVNLLPFTNDILTFSPDTLFLDAAGGIDSFQVFSNTNWNTSTPAEWINLAFNLGTGDSTVTFTYAPNPSTTERITEITLSTGELLPQSIVVIQASAPAFLEVTPTIFNLPETAGANSFTINSNVEWTVGSIPGWVTVDITSGSGDATIGFTYSANPSPDSRSASLVITNPELGTRVIAITQAGFQPVLTVDPAQIMLNAPAGMNSFSITSNLDWTISTEAFWISLETTSGNGSATINFTYTTNEGLTLRNATIIVTAPGFPPAEIEISQLSDQGFLNLSVDTLILPNFAGSTTIDVFSNLNWTSNTGAGWLNFSPGAGMGDLTVGVNYASNSSISPRSTDVVFLADGALPAILHVIQEATPAFLNTSVDTIFVEAAGGPSIFTIFSNTNWMAASSTGWLAIAQPTGNGTVFVDLNVAPNATASERTALINIEPNGLPSATIVVIQEARDAYITPAVDELIFPSNTGDAEIQIFSNVIWTVSNSSNWLNTVGNGGEGDQLLSLIHTSNNSLFPRRDTLRFSSEGIEDVLLPVMQAGQVPDIPWVSSPTSENHSIIIPADFTGTLAGDIPLEVGDAVGFFYTRPDGSTHCSNYFVYLPGENQSIPVYGDDSDIGPKNGFAEGEAFQLRVFRLADEQEYDIVGTYAPIGTDNIITHEGNFSADGISQLISVEFAALIDMTIQLSTGWNMISSYLAPDPADMLEILESISNEVVIIKDQSGATAIPTLGVNALGDWDFLKGYQIKMLQDADLTITGQRLVPADNPIELLAGWQMIAYLLNQERAVEEQFASVENRLNLVKDNLGRVYLPNYNINNIGNLRPGQGYKVRMLNPATLVYTESFAGPVSFPPAAVPVHFALPADFNTGQNATLVLPGAVWQGSLQEGDEIGIFNADGVLCGSAVIEQENVAITVWGDDALTGGAPEGMATAGAYRFQVWRSAADETFDAVVSFASGDGLYQEDDVEVLMTLDLLTSIAEQSPFASMEVYPNPVFGQLTISMPIELDIERILVSDATGRQLAVFHPAPDNRQLVVPTADWPAGLMTVECIGPAGSKTFKVVKQP